MAVKIRLSRRGRKKLAIYDVVVADERAPRDGRFIEKIGTYNPNHNPASININNERALKWLLNGAQPTDTVKAMLSYRGVMLKKHLQIGVLKGAITQEQADEKFQAWIESKEATIAEKVDKIGKEKSDARRKALDAEAAKNQARLDSIKAREDEAKAAADAEAAAIAAAQAPPVEETPTSPVDVTTPEDTQVPQTPTEVAAEEEVPVTETVAEVKTPEEVVEETPVAKPEVETPEAAVEEVPAEDITAQETPAEDTAVEKVPAEDTVEETPAEDTTAEKTPADETPKSEGESSEEEKKA